MPGALPLHTGDVAGVAVTTGIGLTVTVAVAVAIHPFAVLPVIVYVAVPPVLLLLLVSGCAIGVPLPELPPLIPFPSIADHV